MRLVFLGTPEAAVPSLEALIDAGHDVALVITRPDRRRGRGSELSPSPVKTAATRLGLRVGHRLADIHEVDVERGVVVAYGAIIPELLLDKVPMLNVHFSLLPRWRGAAPVQRAILAGDEETGVSIISLEASLDTGPVHVERRVRVDDKTSHELTGELSHVGAAALIEVLATPALLEHPRAQVGEATYAEKITKEMLHLNTHGVGREGPSYCSSGRCLLLRRRQTSSRVVSARQRRSRSFRPPRASRGQGRRRIPRGLVGASKRCGPRARRR